MKTTEQTEIDDILNQFANESIDEKERDAAVEAVITRGRRRRITEVAA